MDAWHRDPDEWKRPAQLERLREGLEQLSRQYAHIQGPIRRLHAALFDFGFAIDMLPEDLRQRLYRERRLGLPRRVTRYLAKQRRRAGRGR